jgi:hypothetical protein
MGFPATKVNDEFYAKIYPTHLKKMCDSSISVNAEPRFYYFVFYLDVVFYLSISVA